MDSCHLAVVTSSPAVEQIKNILNRRSLNQKTQIQSTLSFAFLKGSVFCSVITAVTFLFAGLIILTVRVTAHNHSVLNADSILWIFAMGTFLLVAAISLFTPLIWILTLGMSANHLSQCTGHRAHSMSKTSSVPTYFLRSVCCVLLLSSLLFRFSFNLIPKWSSCCSILGVSAGCALWIKKEL